MQNDIELAARYTDVKFPHKKNKDKKARVRSFRDPDVWYNCSLQKWTCDCMKPSVTGKGCPHLHAAAMKAGLEIHKYMHIQDTHINHKAQYAFEYPGTPSQAEINERALLLQCAEPAYLPPKVGCGKGRPKEQVRRKGPVEQAKRKRKAKKRAAEGKGDPTQPTCKRCYRKGHTARFCPNPPSPNPKGSGSHKRPAPSPASSVGEIGGKRPKLSGSTDKKRKERN